MATNSMKALIEGFASQLQKALAIAQKVNFSFKPDSIQQIVVTGLGGSGIGGNLLQFFAQDILQVPVLVNKTYNLPTFVNKQTLVIASSFSGDTEETLYALQEAIERQAQILCITSGGKLLNIAKEKGFDYIQIPQESPCPRAFLGYSLIQLMAVLKHFAPNFDLEHEVLHVCRQLELYRTQIQEEAQQLAKLFHKRLPIVYADERWYPAILRLQQQINENAKQLCHVNVFPEMNHNELVGWGLDKAQYRNIAVLMLRSNLDHPRVKIRMDICKPIFAQKAAQVYEVSTHGQSYFEQMLYVIHLFDWASFYLAELNGVDAFPVDVINYLKSSLAKYESQAK
ncbi:glucose/mannose-6-phosphate isomerase [Thermonema lapsum]|uniref:Glucose/mannose-6-phosphate isomerase n=1 Tax=Thermonema lapsum TaxID=28195 RepID=A0A846MMN8_9BACT|nr:bifunctional phosphoglucose/phosphomannose isomerase [Thermonema lapsum]NIK72813.1 glucose/mannose-6-phosphate isomerase [Thermonema lapsum]